ncbi:hypothetical protein, partial [Mycoplasma leonicaptivi]|uniref:hypothetical protein n=1 Tax=Mycoplasma leonicaptivi TaxID=36742 RepID=UPI00048413FE
MKHNFKKKILNTVLISSSIVFLPLIATKCANNSNKIYKSIDFKFTNIKSDSAIFEIKFSNLKNNQPNLILEFENLQQYTDFEIDYKNNKAIVILNNLKPNTKYTITRVFDKVLNKDFINESNSISFITLKTDDEKEDDKNLNSKVIDNHSLNNNYNNLNNILFNNIKSKSIDINLSFQTNVNPEDKIEIELTNSSNNSVVKISQFIFSGNTVIFNITNLNPNTSYKISKILFNSKEQDLTNQNKNFTTQQKENDSFSVSNIEISEIMNTSAFIKINFSQHQLSDSNPKTFKLVLNDKEFLTSAYTQNSNYVSFSVSGLTKNTQYNINNLSINDLLIDLSNVSEKAFVTTNNESENELNSKPKSDFIKTKDYSIITQRNKYYDSALNISEKNIELNFSIPYQKYIDSNEKLTYSNEQFNESYVKGTKNIDIERITVIDNNVNINFSQLIEQNTEVKILIKGTNPLQPWSKIVTLNNISGSSASFSTDLLQKNIKNFVLTHTFYDSKLNVYDLNDKYFFSKPLPFNDIDLKEIKFIGDNDKKILYASANLDLDEQKVEYLKDKWFEFIFEAEIDRDDNAAYYNNYYVKKPSVYVPFEKLNKFILSGFMDRVKYTLKELHVVEPYSKDLYFRGIDLPRNSDLSFVKYFNYDLYNEILDKNTQNDFSVQNKDLITNKTNLTTTDLRNIALSNETKNSIPYSIQNFYSLINYKYEMYYRNSKSSNDVLKHFKMIDENNQEVELKSLVGRELLSSKRFDFNPEHTVVSMTKDLSRYKNLEQINDEDVLFNFMFEFDPTHKVLTDYGQGASTRNIVMVSVSYKLIKEQKVIDNSVFNVVHGADDFETQNLYHKILNSMFRFKLSLGNQKLKFEIIAKDEQNTKIFNFKPDHNLSLYNSAFIGNNQFYLFWKNKPGVNISFSESEYNNTKIVNPEEVVSYKQRSEYDDSNFNPSLSEFDPDKLFTLYSKLQKTKSNATRLFDVDNQKGIKDLRKRSFAFRTDGSSWTVLGKVKPSDDNDYRFFVTTNQHVFDGYKRVDYKSNTNPWVQRKMEHVDIKIPVLTSKDKYSSDKTYPILQENNLNFGEIEIPLEPINNFNNERLFPTMSNFKDNQGNQPEKIESRRADLVYAIADFSFFFEKFPINQENNWQFNNRQLNQKEKEVVQFIHNWKNLNLTQVSNQTYVIDDYVNLNAFAATYPVA